MFGKRKARKQADVLNDLQLEVDYIYLLALRNAITEHPEWLPTAGEMVGWFE